MFERLPDKVKKENNTEFKNGLGILFSIKTDTLNKNDLVPTDTSLKIFWYKSRNREARPFDHFSKRRRDNQPRKT
jgi:hypothetical protein